MKTLELACIGFVLSATVGAAGGCNIGGLNEGVTNPGDQAGGVKLSLGDIAVSPDGTFLVFERDDELAVGWVASGEVASLGVRSPARLAFSEQRDVVYVTTEKSSLVAVDVGTRETLWSVPTGIAIDPMVVASDDDRRVVVGGQTSVLVYDTDAGQLVAERDLPRGVVDIEVLPDDARLVAVERHAFIDGLPETQVHVLDLEDGAATTVDVPNCADDIIVPAHGKTALLAPTTCSADPISILYLVDGAETFVKNLPGFGPVALGPDGNTAVGFLDLTNVDASLFEDPTAIPLGERYHLMVIDTGTLDYDFAAYGPALPRYAMTPDGNVLLVDTKLGDTQASLFDVASRTYVPIANASNVRFERLSFSSDSEHAYVLSDEVGQVSTAEGAWTDYDLFDLNVAEARVDPLVTTFRPRNLNISPDDTTLFLRRDSTHICVYDLATQNCVRDLLLGAE